MPKLVNLGSLCVDHVYRVPHLTTSGETLASSSHEVFAGGKGLNQSLAARKAGAVVVHVCCVGPDGQLLLDVLDHLHGTMWELPLDAPGEETTVGGVLATAVDQAHGLADTLRPAAFAGTRKSVRTATAEHILDTLAADIGGLTVDQSND